MSVIGNTTHSLRHMRDRVYFMISENSGSRIFTRGNVDMAINLGLSVVSKECNREPKTARFNTEAETSEYVIPDPVLQYGAALVDNVWVDGDIIDASDYPIEDEAPGKPDLFYVTGNVLGLVPAPDAEYSVKVRYRQEHRPLENDDDETYLSDLAINAAVLYACYMLKLKDEEFQSADRFREEFSSALKTACGLQTGVYKAAQTTYGGAV